MRSRRHVNMDEKNHAVIIILAIDIEGKKSGRPLAEVLFSFIVLETSNQPQRQPYHRGCPCPKSFSNPFGCRKCRRL